jgi:hypothetical protein
MSRKILASVGIVAAAAALGMYLSRGPWLAYRDQKQKADTATREMQKAEREKKDLLIKEALLKTPMGRQRLARESNHRKPGETILDANGAPQNQ